MLKIYGSPFSSPTNKIRYVANYLNLPFEFQMVNLAAGEQRSADYLKINPYGRIPAINDDGFTLAESSAIIRYFANKQKSIIYPTDLHQRAHVDQWIDYASIHVMLALARIMYNTYFYKLAKVAKDERSLEDGKNFINQYLPVVNQQLTQSAYIAMDSITLADFAMIAALDTLEMAQVDLTPYPAIQKWRSQLMSDSFYTKCHPSYSETFKKILERMA